MSASKKRKIKKKAKLVAEQQKQKQMAEASKNEALIEAAHNIEDLDLPPDVELSYKKLKPNVSNEWLAKLRAKLRTDPSFKGMFEKKGTGPNKKKR